MSRGSAHPRQPPAFAPGTVVVSERGVGYRVGTMRWSQPPAGIGAPGEAAFEAERLDGAPARVLLRVGAAEPASQFGTFVAASWPAADAQEGGIGTRDDSDWVALSNVAHPGIAVTLDAGQLVETRTAPARSRVPDRVARLAPELPFAALAWVEGATLATLMRAAVQQSGRPLGPGAALAVGSAVASALAWLHASVAQGPTGPRAVWHGRLDAEHVFVSAAGACRLATPVRLIPHDFRGGLISLADLAAAPELTPALEVPAAFTGAAADLLHLGALLFELVAGRLPGSDTVPDGPYRAGVPGAAPALSTLVRNVPAGLEACVQRLLATSQRRFGSAGEVMRALARARNEYEGPKDADAMAAVVKVLGRVGSRAQGKPPALAVLGDGRDGTRTPVTLQVTETS